MNWEFPLCNESLFRIAFQNRKLYRISKLSHITWPIVCHNHLQRLFIHELYFGPNFSIIFSEEMLNEKGDIIAPLAQRRHSNFDRIEEVIELFKEVSSINHPPKIS